MVCLALGWLLAPGLGQAQPAVGGQGFKFAEYFEAPHQTQMKSMLEGARGRTLTEGQVQVEEAKYRTWRVNGEGELVAEAPECSYDPKTKSITSAGPLHLQSADGRFAIDGVGFMFQQTNSTLLISNRVHTTVRPDLANQAGAGTNAEAVTPETIHINADQFEYGQKTGIGVYRGHVHVTGTNLDSTAGVMTVVLSLAEQRLQTLTAEQQVVVNYETMRATGERAVYAEETGLIHVTGQPTWRVGEQEGRGDELVLDRTNRVFRAQGHAWMKVPAQSMGGSGFIGGGGSRTNSQALTNHFVEIRCAEYEVRTNQAVFRQDVRVEDLADDQRQGQMTCETVTLYLAGTNELQSMVAERRVVISHADSDFTAERAVYTGTNGLLDLTGNPAWRAGTRSGSGDVLRVHPAREEMLASGNAVMRMPASELGQADRLAGGKVRIAAPRTNQFAVIHSQQYFVTPESALFKGGVRIEHPQMQWVCQEITMLSTPELGKEGRIVIAEPDVVFEAVDEQGRKLHGTGDKAVLTHRVTPTLTNDLIVLTGRPAVVQTTNVIGRNQTITLDMSRHTFVTPGKYSAWGPVPEGVLARLRSSRLK